MEPEKNRELYDLINNSYISSVERVVTEIVRVINDPNSSAKDLKEVIELDPPLTGRILRRANSAYYSRRRGVSEVQDAVILLGFDVVKELALNQKVAELFADDTVIHGYSRLALWKQSVAVALAAKFIYRRELALRGDDVYAAGLLHNIGIIVEDQFLHQDFVRVLQRSREEQRDFLRLETEAFGFDHTNIGMALANNWNLPVDLVMAIGYHHAPESASADSIRMAATLFIANYLCQQAEIGFTHAPVRNKRQVRVLMDRLKLSEKGLDLILEAVVQELRRMEKHNWFQIAA